MFCMKYFGWFFVLSAFLTLALPIAAQKSMSCAEGVVISVSVGGEIVEMDIEEYTLSVLLTQADGRYGEQTLCSLAVAVRSCGAYFSSYGLKHTDFDVCTNGNCCLALGDIKTADGEYLSRLSQAVDATRGEILTLDSLPAMALFTECACTGTRYCNEFPYLAPVANGEKCELHKEIIEYHTDSLPEPFQNGELCIVYGENEKCELAVVNGKMLSADELVSSLSLPSYEFTLDFAGDTLTATCYGAGHGCGLDLCGADKMAKSGFSYKDILSSYFKGLQLNKIYNS